MLRPWWTAADLTPGWCAVSCLPERKAPCKKPAHVACLAEPRAAREKRPVPPPRRVPAFADAPCC